MYDKIGLIEYKNLSIFTFGPTIHSFTHQKIEKKINLVPNDYMLVHNIGI